MNQANQLKEEMMKYKVQVEKQAQHTMADIDKNSQTCQAVQEQIEQLKKQHEIDLQSVAHNFDRLQAQLKQYHINVATAIKSFQSQQAADVDSVEVASF